MVGHGGSSAGSYLADPTSPIPSHCASIVATSTLRVNFAVNSFELLLYFYVYVIFVYVWLLPEQLACVYDTLAAVSNAFGR